jgi:hypothetical protein
MAAEQQVANRAPSGIPNLAEGVQRAAKTSEGKVDHARRDAMAIAAALSF